MRSRPFLAVFPFLALAVLAAPAVAEARPNVERHGGQWEILAGAAWCLPGKADCSHEDAGDLVGKTRPSFGMGASLGYRPLKFLFVGAAYNLGLLKPDYDFVNTEGYDSAYQHSVFGVVRPILPLWRIDLGVDLAPGWSRLTFRHDKDDKVYTQGFAFKFGPVVDIWVTRRIFVGVKADFILNAHRNACVVGSIDGEQQTLCHRTNDRDLAAIHQVIFGFHLGGTFL